MVQCMKQSKNIMYYPMMNEQKEDSLEEAYTQFVLKLREIYKDAIEFSSNRWHMEMKEKP